MVLDPPSNRLFVADRDNHCVRVIDLSNDHQVSTLAGSGRQGYEDGPFDQASFHKPEGLSLLPGGRLVVYDGGNARLRLLDLNERTVATLAGNGHLGVQDGAALEAQVGPIWGMTYLEPQDALYLSQPGLGALRKLDLKSRTITTPLKDHPKAPQPEALCAAGDRLFLSDRKNGEVLELTPREDVPMAVATPAGMGGPFAMKTVAKARKVLALAWVEGSLYALEADTNTPVSRLIPAERVGFITARGEVLRDPGRLGHFGDVMAKMPMALVPDPASPRKFYLSHPSRNMVTSFRDLSLADRLLNESYNSDGLMDFEYPRAKPPNVFRILLLGDSHLYHNYHGMEWADNRMELLAKRTELNLNMRAALQGAKVRFEVLTRTSPASQPLFVWPYYVVPTLVKDYDVDLVLLTQTYLNCHPSIYSAYFNWPLTKEGIPAEKFDPEHALRPWKEKLRGDLNQELYDRCAAKGLLRKDPPHQDLFGEFRDLVADPDVRDVLVRMIARPVRLLKSGLGSRKTLRGDPVRFELCLLPLPNYEWFPRQRAFWSEVEKETRMRILDLTDLMTVFRVSLFPLSVMDGYDHFNSAGHEFLSLALARELVQRGIIPLEPGF
jgi:hypothetical protein